MAWQHGASGYRSYKCRCEICTEAHKERHARENEARKVRLEADPSLAPHGVINTYVNWGCRCEDCREVWSKECKRQAENRKARKQLKELTNV